MFRLCLDDARLMKKSVDAIAQLINEAAFEVTQEGLHLRAMDPSNIAMVDFKLPKSAFLEYSLEQDTLIGVDFDIFKKIFSRAKAGDRVYLIKEKEGVLDIIFEGRFRRKFRFQLIETSSTALKEPSIEFQSVVKIRAGEVKEALKDAGLISSHVVLRTDETGFHVEAESESSELRATAERGSDALIDLQVDEPARAMFSLDYLQDMVKNADNDSILTIYLRTDAPLKLHYSLGEAEFTYYLAPRIER